jgi:hypothetical protein
MKILNKNKINLLLVLFLGLTVMTSCKKYKNFTDGEVIDNSFTGTITDTSNAGDPDGDFAGTGDSGTYSFAWVNSGIKAKLKFDISTPSTGSVQMILNDKKGKEVLNQTLIGGSGVDSYEGISQEGKGGAGTWKATIIFKNFTGDGSYEIDPAN